MITTIIIINILIIIICRLAGMQVSRHVGTHA